MLGFSNQPRLILALSMLFFSGASAQNETQEPIPGCELIDGTNAQCGLTDYEGLNGHTPAQLMFDIMNASSVPNDTFYPNDSHVTCLFGDETFVLSFGISDPVTFNISPPKSGVFCVFPKDVSKGGLTLGEIKDLSYPLIFKCEKCGVIGVSTNISELGTLQFNWQDVPVCEPPCIDPSRDLKNASTAGTATTNKTSAATRYDIGLVPLASHWVMSSAFWLMLAALGMAM